MIADSASRVITEVCQRTNTSKEDTENALKKVTYHYKKSRLNVNLKAYSGIGEVIYEINEAKKDDKNE